MKMIFFFGLFFSLFAFDQCLFPAQARAELKIRGFADMVSSLTTSDFTLQWLGNDGRRLNSEGSSRIGLNLSSEISDQWDFAGQLVGRGYAGVAEDPGYVVQADWLFITYHPTSSLQLRAGRQIFPIYLFSETIDVGFTYPWVRLPASVYSLMPIKSFNGLSAAYNFTFADWKMIASVFGGTASTVSLSTGGIGGAKIDERYLKGASINLVKDETKFAIAYKSSHPIGTVYVPTPGGTQVVVPVDLGDEQIFSLGGLTEIGKFSLVSELGRNISPGGYDNRTGAYGSLSYHFFDGFLSPYVAYSKEWLDFPRTTYPNPAIAAAQGPKARQTELHQWLTGINLRAADSIMVKFEVERDALEYLNSGLNFEANSFSVSVDAIF